MSSLVNVNHVSLISENTSVMLYLVMLILLQLNPRPSLIINNLSSQIVIAESCIALLIRFMKYKLTFDELNDNNGKYGKCCNFLTLGQPYTTFHHYILFSNYSASAILVRKQINQVLHRKTSQQLEPKACESSSSNTVTG